jgi:CRP-like cAMP-binding protein
MEKHVLAESLAKLRFSAPLPEDVLQRLSTFAIMQGYPEGSCIFREGEMADSLLIIYTGRIALEMSVPGRDAVRILTLGPGDLVAWSALLADGKMTTSATALEDTQVVVISASEVSSACGTNRDFGYFFMRRVACALAERLHATRLKLLDSSPDASLHKLDEPKPEA